LSIETPTAVRADENVFLIGRPPFGEYLGFMMGQTVEGPTADRRQLADAWRAANDHIRELEQAEAGWADEPPLEPLPDALTSLKESVLVDPVVQKTFAFVPIDLALVELDRLIVFQKHINLAYVRELRARLGEAPTPQDVFRFCLPFEGRSDPVPLGARTAQQGWTFSSPSTDFRQLDVALLAPEQAPGLAPAGVPVVIVAVAIGYGANYLTALHVDGRLVLHNGSHRAYALREAGHTHVPCLVQEVSRREELEVVANDELANHAERYLDDPRPPVLKDYFDEQLRMIVHVPAKVRQLEVGIGVKPADVPAS
jgi:hypothetical protein